MSLLFERCNAADRGKAPKDEGSTLPKVSGRQAYDSWIDACLWAVTGDVDPPQGAAARHLLRDQLPQHDAEAVDVDLQTAAPR